jgi:hypothetical protein
MGLIGHSLIPAVSQVVYLHFSCAGRDTLDDFIRARKSDPKERSTPFLSDHVLCVARCQPSLLRRHRHTWAASATTCTRLTSVARSSRPDDSALLYRLRQHHLESPIQNGFRNQTSFHHSVCALSQITPARATIQRPSLGDNLRTSHTAIRPLCGDLESQKTLATLLCA